MNESEVKVIQPGYAKWIGPTQQRADGTITLIKGPNNVIVDSGGPWDKQAILKALRREKIRPCDINYVICTHGHSDHTGNNNLFPNATLILSYDVCKGDLYTFHDFAHGQPYRVGEQIEVIPTPGHTTQDISVIVKTKQGVIAIVGDLFECAEDLKNESLWRSFSEVPETQKANRDQVLNLADFIVPGHGEMFRVGKQFAVTEAAAVPTTPPLETKVRSSVIWYVLVPLGITVLGGLLVWLLTR
jgi:glyoxylase-like metal-dependent hydrolase (beta-lactamase superfamily II)